MHAISLKQPWATLLVHAIKTIEVRKWSTKRRGPVLIHASAHPDERVEAWSHVPDHLLEHASTLRGGIVGAGEIVSCRIYRDRDQFAEDQEAHRNELEWFEKPPLYGFVLKKLRVLPFQRCSGWMRFFPIPEDILDALPLNDD